jgi:hypothetical protein
VLTGHVSQVAIADANDMSGQFAVENVRSFPKWGGADVGEFGRVLAISRRAASRERPRRAAMLRRLRTAVENRTVRPVLLSA